MNRKIEMYRDRANWNEEPRRFVEGKIRELEAYENFQRVLEELDKASWSIPKGFSQQSVREDRDSS
ncbi:conserved hypothetical protein [Ignisphaera aggregans DSM 17230]|uniref:CopG family transcriptional regulator n=1 Tax=Ignisphaera aggregans (strain DSM 17230 / JCM 13409 / AQ1.S1) TaxID=583356 RepID=E0STB2_IGNAA|nr:conserved hypothetical protein [Ignisphaera aggregans DSM 17230]